MGRFIMSNCIVCKTKIRDKDKVLDLGNVYPSKFISKNIDCLKSPLSLSQCPNTGCKLVQMTEILPADSMYREYWYQSSLNSSMVKSLCDVVDSAKKRTKFQHKAVLDIGCNDGTLLNFYPSSIFKVGFDPANIAEKSIKKCDVFYNSYFPEKNLHFKTKFDIITSIAMFYDVTEPLEFVQAIKKLLGTYGTWVCQMTELTSTLKRNAYDNICHEHIAYYTLNNFKGLVESCELEIYDVEYNNVNGASIRTYIGHPGKHKVKKNVLKSLEEEESFLKQHSWDDFNKKIKYINNTVFNFIKNLKSENKKVCGLGASTKGNTFLQCAGLTNQEIDVIYEVSEDKYGLYTLGSNIKIVPESLIESDKPDCLLVLPWHFIDNIMQKQENFIKNGGCLLVAMPEPAVFKIVNNELKKILL